MSEITHMFNLIAGSNLILIVSSKISFFLGIKPDTYCVKYEMVLEGGKTESKCAIAYHQYELNDLIFI